jgi:hypothetical protein
MLQSFANGAIEYFIDRNRHIVFGRWEGDFRGKDLLSSVPVLWRDYPEIGRSGAIHDMTDFTGMLEHRYTREMIRLRTELVPNFDPRVRTAIVTADPMKTVELKVTKASSPEREFRVFSSNAAALEWVIADEPGNPCAVRGRPEGPLPWWFDRRPERGGAPGR